MLNYQRLNKVAVRQVVQAIHYVAGISKYCYEIVPKFYCAPTIFVNFKTVVKTGNRIVAEVQLLEAERDG